MKEELTEIVFILDESGSMGSVKSDTIGGFNQFVKDQKEMPGKANFTFVKFSDYIETVYDGVAIEKVDDLNDKTYHPTYTTALLDALGQTIEKVKTRIKATPKAKRPAKVIVAVLTDGEENASREFNTVKIQDLVKVTRDKKGWEYLFLGADIDAWGAGNSMGIGNTVSMDKFQMKGNFSKMSAYTASYRSVGEVDTASTFAMSDEAVQATIDELKKDKD